MKTAYFRHAALYAVIGVALLGFAVVSGTTYIANQSKALVGVDQPISVTASNFKGNPNGSYAGTAWDPDGTNTAKALMHQGIVVFYKWNKAGYGDYYSAANMGADETLYKTVKSNEVVHCANSATVEGSHNSHLAYSPNIEGMYDGPGHYWCSMNGTAVDPLPGPENGKMMPDLHNTTAVLQFTLPDGTNYHKSASTGAWVKCTSYAGPYTATDAGDTYNSSGDTGKNFHYHCLSFEGGRFVEPESGPTPPATYSNVNFSYTSSVCAPGSQWCGSIGTYGSSTMPCGFGTHWCQTTDVNTRYCSANSYCMPENFNPPAPTWTLNAPLNPRTSPPATYIAGTSIPFMADLSVSGTGVIYGSTDCKVEVSSNSSFSTIIWSNTTSQQMSATAVQVGSEYPAGATALQPGTYYFRMKVSMGGQTSGWAVSPTTFTVTSATTTTTSTCALNLTLNDGKTIYTKGDSVNYTYSCSPVGTTAASVTVQVVKPDGIATTYNTGTNIGTAAMGFETSNFAAGTYTLRACLTSGCTTGVASVSFTVKTGTTTTTDTTTTTTTTTTTPTTTTTTTPVVAAKNCGVGEKCPSGSWCTNGRQCNYPDGNITCSSWNSNTCPSGTKFCSLTDTNCIEPGTWGSLNGWCMQGMECYSTDGTKKWCEPNMPPTTMGVITTGAPIACPAGTKFCSPTDPNCIEPGEYGTTSGWCKNSMECFVNGRKYCQPWTNDPSKPATCPAGSNLCSPGDTNCIEPGATGPINGWCKQSMECYSTDGTKKFCQKWESPTGAGAATTMMPMMASMTCPADYPKACRPDDRNCIEIGQKGPESGWCTSGGKQCFVEGGMYCARQDEECPSGATACRKGETNCIEPGKYGPTSGWCGGSNAVPCYTNDGAQMYCASFTMTGPTSWEKAQCPAGAGRCRPDDKYCLEFGETGPANSWCAAGMMKWNDDGTITCVSMAIEGTVTVTPVTPETPEPEICIQVLKTAYNPTTMECKTFSTPCKVPKDWKDLERTQVCQNGIVATVTDISENKDSVLKTLSEDLQRLKDLKYQLKKVSTDLPEIRELAKLIEDAIANTKDIENAARQRFEREKQTILEKMKTLHSETLPNIESKMGDANLYIEFAMWKINFQNNMYAYRDELQRAEQGSEYAQKLQEGIEKLEGLFRAAESQRGASLSQLFDVIKTAQRELDAIISNYHNTESIGFVDITVADLEKAVEDFNNRADKLGRKVSRFTLRMLGEFEKMVERLVDLKSEEKSDKEFNRLLDEALRLRDKLAQDLGGSYSHEADIEEILNSRFEEKLVNSLVEKVLGKVSDKLTIMLDTVMQSVAVKIAEITTIATERLTQSLSNLTSVVETQREQIVEAKNNILERVQEVEKLLKETKLALSARNKLNEVMELAATVNWCGTMGELVQSKINSMTLALENNELATADIDTLRAEIEKLSNENNEACYLVGAANFRDTPMHLWYFEPAQFNSTNGYIKGYADAQGNPLGKFGPSDPTLRIEALAMAMRMFDVPVGSAVAPQVPVFGVPAWGMPYVNGAMNAGVSFDRTFLMDQPITRAQAAELFAEVGQDYIALPEDVTYADDYKDYSKFASDTEQARAVDALTELKVFQGYEGNFNPDASLLRSEFATVNMRLTQNLGLSNEE